MWGLRTCIQASAPACLECGLRLCVLHVQSSQMTHFESSLYEVQILCQEVEWTCLMWKFKRFLGLVHFHGIVKHPTNTPRLASKEGAPWPACPRSKGGTPNGAVNFQVSPNFPWSQDMASEERCFSPPFSCEDLATNMKWAVISHPNTTKKPQSGRPS